MCYCLCVCVCVVAEECVYNVTHFFLPLGWLLMTEFHMPVYMRLDGCRYTLGML